MKTISNRSTVGSCASRKESEYLGVQPSRNQQLPESVDTFCGHTLQRCCSAILHLLTNEKNTHYAIGVSLLDMAKEMLSHDATCTRNYMIHTVHTLLKSVQTSVVWNDLCEAVECTGHREDTFRLLQRLKPLRKAIGSCLRVR